MNILGSLFSIKRNMGLGLAVAAFLVAILPRFSSQQTGSQTAIAQKAQANSGVISMETAPSQEIPDSDNPPSEEAGTVLQDGEPSSLQQPSSDNLPKETNPIFKELEFSEEGFNWHRDWWKYLALAIGSLLVLYFGLRITKMILRLAIFLLCIVAGVLGAICLEPLLSPWLSPKMPETLTRYMTSQHLGYALGFLICYLLATLILSFLPRKMQGGPASEKV